MAFKDLPGIDHVAFAFGHLLAFFIEHMSQTDHVTIGGSIRDHRGDGQQGIEPAPRLVDGLADKVGRKITIEFGFAAHRPAPLGVRHRPGIKPAVDHLRHAAHGFAAPGVRKDDLINVRTMQIQFVQLSPAELLQFFARTDDAVFAFAVGPDRQRRAPVALPRKGPIAIGLQPVSKTTLLDMLRHPANLLIVLNHRLFDTGGPNIPGILGVVNQRRAGTITEGVVVFVTLRTKHPTLFFEFANDQRIGVFEEHARVRRGRQEFAIDADRMDNGQAFFLRNGKVIAAVGRRNVHHAGTGVKGDEVAGDDSKCIPRRIGGDVVEQLPVTSANQFGALQTAFDLQLLFAK